MTDTQRQQELCNDTMNSSELEEYKDWKVVLAKSNGKSEPDNIEIREGDLVVPDHCESLHQALYAIEPNQRIFLRAGTYSWRGPLIIYSTDINIYGQKANGGTTLTGEISLTDTSTGTFHSIKFFSKRSHCVRVWGHAKWNFKECNIESSGGLALVCSDNATVKIHSCVIGGQSEVIKAKNGIFIDECAKISAESCTIQHTRTHGVLIMNNGEITLSSCTIQFAEIAIGLSNVAKAKVTSTIFNSNTVVLDAYDSTPTLVLDKYQINNNGRMWWDAVRPVMSTS